VLVNQAFTNEKNRLALPVLRGASTEENAGNISCGLKSGRAL
jgi:hypothetical protein